MYQYSRLIICALVQCLVWCFSTQVFAQKINGFVYDKETHEPLIGVTIVDTISKAGVISNEYGYFNFPANTGCISLSYIGYDKQFLTFENDTTLSISLNKSAIDLETVEILSYSSLNETNSSTIITPQKLEKLPSIGGERDPLKYIATLSGVNSGREGQSAFFVRGGGLDQNLVLLDGAPIYGTGHFFSFISLINPDAIKSIQFYRGNAPVNIGGRIASTTDINFKEGNRNRISGKFDLGLINSKLLLEGPLSKKSSFMFASRVSYLELINIKKKINFNRGLERSYRGYTFFDINAKVNYDIKSNERVFLNLYFGGDLLRDLSQFYHKKELNFAKPKQFSQSFSLKYIKEINNKVFFNSVLYYSGERRKDIVFEEFNEILPADNRLVKSTNFESKLNSSINDVGLKLTADFAPNSRNYFKVGVGYIHHIFNTNNSNVVTGSNLHYSPKYDTITSNSPLSFSSEWYQFLQHNFKFNRNFEIVFGMRNTIYTQKKEVLNRMDWSITTSYTLGNNALKLNLSQNNQFSEALLQNESLLDRVVWIPTSQTYLPPVARQISIGYYKSLRQINLKTSIEGYYKTLNNLIEFEFADFYSLNKYNNWENNVIGNIEGRSYGVEFNLEYTINNFDFRMSHTLSKSDRRLPSNIEWYPFKFDLRNSLNVNMHYSFKNGWDIGLSFIYNDGIRMSIPTIMGAPNAIIDQASFFIKSRNNFQLPPNHRLDISISKKYLNKVSKREHAVGLNIYNAYNRQNASYASFKPDYVSDGVSSKIVGFTLKKIAILPILPSINYVYKF